MNSFLSAAVGLSNMLTGEVIFGGIGSGIAGMLVLVALSTLAETLYAYTSQAASNGSAFAGYTGYVQPDGTNTGAYGITFANVAGALAMLLGRNLPLVLTLAIAGGLAGDRIRQTGPGTLRTDTPRPSPSCCSRRSSSSCC